MNLTWLLFSFNGRISRKYFWIFNILTIGIILVPAFTFLGFDTPKADNYVTFSSFVILWPSLAIQAKRWHDRDKSAWWILITLIPLIGPIWALIENGFLSGTVGKNKYGDDPKNSSGLIPNAT
jgi:uncharacterized membrane protein YhaH (DUF805 family)